MICIVLFLFLFSFLDAQYVFDLYKNQPALQAAEVIKILAEAVPGESYPTLTSIPETDFSCDKMGIPGFFADSSTVSRCQVFHRCDINGLFTSYLCPNSTLFSQILLTCDYFFNVDCQSEVQYRNFANSRLYQPGAVLFDSPPADYVSKLNQWPTASSPVVAPAASARANTGEVRNFPAKIVTSRVSVININTNQNAGSTAQPQNVTSKPTPVQTTTIKSAGNNASVISVSLGAPRQIRAEVDNNITSSANISSTASGGLQSSGTNAKIVSELQRSKDLLLDVPYTHLENITLVNVSDNDFTNQAGNVTAASILLTTRNANSTVPSNMNASSVVEVLNISNFTDISVIPTQATNSPKTVPSSSTSNSDVPVNSSTTASKVTEVSTVQSLPVTSVTVTAATTGVSFNFREALLPEFVEFGLMNETVTQAIPADWDNTSANMNPPVEHVGFPSDLSLRSEHSPEPSGSAQALGDIEVAPNITETGNITIQSDNATMRETAFELSDDHGADVHVVSSAVLSELEKELTTTRGVVISDMPTSTPHSSTSPPAVTPAPTNSSLLVDHLNIPPNSNATG